MAPSPRKLIVPAWVDEMHQYTASAFRIFTSLADVQLPPDAWLAWTNGLRTDPRYHWNDLTRQAINRARDEGGMIWREIAVVLEGDEEAADRVERKQKWRNDAWEDFQAGVGEFQVSPSGGMPPV